MPGGHHIIWWRMTMLFTVFLPFAFVHFITFAILIDETPASQVFHFTVFLEKTTRCQLFTFLNHISLSHFHAATHIYKPNSAAFNTAYQDIFHLIRYNATNYGLRRYIPQIIWYWPVNQLFQIWQSLPDRSL